MTNQQVDTVFTAIVCGTALPAPTVTAAETGVAPAPDPTVPEPRVMVMTFVPETWSAVARSVGVPIDVVIVATAVPGLLMVTNTCADWPQAKLTA